VRYSKYVRVRHDIVEVRSWVLCPYRHLSITYGRRRARRRLTKTNPARNPNNNNIVSCRKTRKRCPNTVLTFHMTTCGRRFTYVGHPGRLRRDNNVYMRLYIIG